MVAGQGRHESLRNDLAPIPPVCDDASEGIRAS
jgi:hypothetical protein